MLTKKHKNLLDIKTNTLVENISVGDHKTNMKAKGIEFADFREYSDGEDSKNIDWVVSSKEGKIITRLFEEERDLDIYLLPFFGEEINFSMNGVNKRDILDEVVYILGLSAVKLQNNVGSFLYNNGKKELYGAKKSQSHFLHLFHKMESCHFIQCDINSVVSDFNNLKINKSLVFLFTSDLEIDEKLLKIASLKNDFIVCSIFHSFENNLDGEGIISLGNHENKITLDLDDKKRKQEYIKKRKQKVIDFRKKVFRSGGYHIYLDEKSDIFMELYKFFINRS